MNRRVFLSCVSALGFAGCTGVEESGRPTTGQTATTPATPTTTPATTTRTTTSTSTTTSTTSTSTTETTTTTEQPTTTTTVSPQERIAGQLETARNKLTGAYRTFLEFGDGNGLDGIDARTSDFDRSAIEEQLQATEDVVQSISISKGSDSQQSMFQALRVGVRVIRAASKAQSHLMSCYQALGREVDALKEGNVSKASNHAKTLAQEYSRAKRQHQRANRDGSAYGFKAVRLVDNSDASKLVRRIGIEVRTFRGFKRANGKVLSGLKKFTDGYEAYHDDYHDAVDLFDDARERLATAEKRLSFPSKRASYLDEEISFFKCYITATKEAADAFERAADYGDEEKSEQRREAEDEAREALSECDGASDLI